MICETRIVFVRLKMSPQSENLLLCLPELYTFACFVTVLVHLTWIRKYRYCTAGLWIRIDSMRIWIRIQAKTELSKTISFSNFFEIKIWVKSNKKNTGVMVFIKFFSQKVVSAILYHFSGKFFFFKCIFPLKFLNFLAPGSGFSIRIHKVTESVFNPDLDPHPCL
jgi:hypothetical protein